MGPETVAVATALAPYAITALKWLVAGGVALVVHKTHNQTVQAIANGGAQVAQQAGDAAAQAALAAMQSGAKPADVATAARNAAVGAALGIAANGLPLQGPPAPPAAQTPARP